MSRSSFEVFFLTVPKNFVGEPCIRKFVVSKKILCIRNEYQFSPFSFLSHSAEKFSLSEKFPYQKFSCIGGGIMVLSKFFSFTWLKNFVRGPFCVLENFWHRVVLCLRGAGGERVSRLSVEIGLSYTTETFPRGTVLCFGKFPVSKNIMDKRGI